MRFTKWFTLGITLLFFASHFFPWLVVESRQLTISGLDATGTRFGKPGVLSLLFGSLFFLFNIIPRGWSRWPSIIFGAFNLGWVVRNFILLSMCYGGECPQRQPFFYIYMVSALLMLVLAMLQPVAMKEETKTAHTGGGAV